MQERHRKAVTKHYLFIWVYYVVSMTSIFLGYNIKLGSGLSFGSTSNLLSNTGVTSLQGDTGALSLSAGTGISISSLTITNAGVTSLTAGTGISLSGSTGDVTVTNSYTLPTDVLTSSSTYVAALTAGTGITLATTAATKSIEITSSGGGSGGGGVNVSYSYKAGNPFDILGDSTYEIGTIKTSSNGIIQVSLMAYSSTATSTTLANLLIVNSTDGSTTSVRATISSVINSDGSYANPINIPTGQPAISANGGVLILAIFTGLTANTTYNIYVYNYTSSDVLVKGFVAYLQGS